MVKFGKFLCMKVYLILSFSLIYSLAGYKILGPELLGLSNLKILFN